MLVLFLVPGLAAYSSDDQGAAFLARLLTAGHTNTKDSAHISERANMAASSVCDCDCDRTV